MVSSEGRQPRGGVFLVGILALLTATAALSIDMYLPTLPTLGQVFSAGPAEVQLTLSTFFFGFGLGQLIYGPLSDQLGRKPPLLVGMSIYAVASLLCSLAPSIHALIAFRFLQAIGASAGPVLARAMVRDLYDQEDGARVLSYIVLALGFAPLLAPLVGGYVLVWWGWSAVFAILAVIGALIFVLCLVSLPESLPAERRKHVHPFEMLRRYRRLLTSRRYLGFMLTATGAYIGLYSYISGSPFVFIQVYHVAAQHYGFIFGTNALGLMAAAALNGRLVRRLGSAALLRGGVIAISVAGAALALAGLLHSADLAFILVPLFFFIAAFSFVAPNAISAGLSVYPEIAGAASALSGALQFWFGAAVSSALGVLHDATALPMTAMMGGGALAALLIYGLLVRRG